MLATEEPLMPPSVGKFTSDPLYLDLLKVRDEIFRFLRHPSREIKVLPDLSWRQVVLAHFIISMATGFAGGFFSLRLTNVLMGIIVTPLIAGGVLAVAALFLTYTFQIFAERELSYRRLFLLLLFANIPFFVFQTVAVFFAPITLIGLAFTGYLLVQGLVHIFDLPKSLCQRLITTIFVLFCLVFLWNNIDFSELREQFSGPSSGAPEVHLGN